MNIATLILSPRVFTAHLLICLLVFSTSFAAPRSLRASSATKAAAASQDRSERSPRAASQRKGDTSRSSNEEIQENGFVTYSDGERSVCRDMSKEEVQNLRRDPEQMRQMRVITQRERDQVLRRSQTEANAEATSLKIILRSTPQLDGFPAAKDAFIRAAAAWEAQIKNPITIIMDVDYGPTRFGQAYPANVLGSTSTPSYRVKLRYAAHKFSE